MKNEWVLSKIEIKQALNNGKVFLDSRTDNQYMGLNKHPKTKALGNQDSIMYDGSMLKWIEAEFPMETKITL